MRCYISVVCALSVLAALSCAAPTNLQLDTLDEQVIDNVIQNITSQLFRVVGRVILQNGGLGGGGGGASGGSSVSVVLPTFPPDEEDEDDDDNDQVQTTTKALETRISDARTTTENSFQPPGVALSVNEVANPITEDTLFTDNGNIKGRIDNNEQDNSDERTTVQFLNRVGIVDEDNIKTENFQTTTEISNSEIANPNDTNKNASKDDDSSTTDKKITDSSTENDAHKGKGREKYVDRINGVVIDLRVNDDDDYEFSTTTETENLENNDANEISNSNIDAISNAIVAIRFGANDTNTTDNEILTTEITETTNRSENALVKTESTIDNLNIKIFDGGKIVNTIPLISNNIVDDNDEMNGAEIEYTSPASSSDSLRSRRIAREAEDQDQEAAASGGNAPNPGDDLSNVDSEDADRDKRYLPFGGDAHVSAGGSGNFLFDIIRQTADGAARAAGTVYRMVAGTENLGLGLTATSTATRILDATSPQLIAGSGATEESDEKENAPIGAGGIAEVDVAKSADGYTEGIPGPITRLFVVANRGLANLVQDLILRLAQTSERIVNFKARLITALI